MSLPVAWPHQIFADQEVDRLIRSGCRRICVTSPTGGGKSLMMCRWIMRAMEERGWKCVLYTPRKLLTEQMGRVLRDVGIPYGVRAADFEDDMDFSKPVQIAAPSTEVARSFRRVVWLEEGVRWQPHPAEIVFFDEVHMQKRAEAQKLMRYHLDRGAVIVGVTATPIGLSDLFDELVVAGTNSELRACGAHVRCYVYGPSELDTSKIKPQKTGEYSIGDIRKEVWTPAIFGEVVKHYKILNPERKPCLLFAPGVAESVWFAEKLTYAGIRAAHIDGEDCWLDGESYTSKRETRDYILDLVKCGDVKVLCNRFVMREGIDLPCLYHEILATPIGSTVSYIQVVGRLLRAHAGLDHVILQDHGGNWHRHGSPNMDRDWETYWAAPEHAMSEVRADNIREGKEEEPIHCPQCHAIRTHGAECHECGFRHPARSRMVIQHDGQLREYKGDIFRPRRRELRHDTERLWTSMYYRMKACGRTFRQAEGLFFYENHYYPPRSLPLMPKKDIQMWLKIGNVPKDQLIQKEEALF